MSEIVSGVSNLLRTAWNFVWSIFEYSIFGLPTIFYCALIFIIFNVFRFIVFPFFAPSGMSDTVIRVKDNKNGGK